MTTYKKDIRNTAIVIAGLLLLSFSGLLWYNNKTLKKEADYNRLRQDSILATKLLLDKEINDLNLSITAYKDKNASLDSSINKTTILLNEKIKMINSLKSENASVKRLKKELNDLKKIRQSFEKQMEALLAENARLKKEVAQLKEQLSNLPPPVMDKTIITSNNFRVELKKSNDKITIRSKKVRNIHVSFEVKSNNKESKTENIYIVVKDANGNIISPAVSDASVKGETIKYSAIHKVELTAGTQKINVNIKTTAKIKAKGIMKVLVFSESDGLIGSAEIPTT